MLSFFRSRYKLVTSGLLKGATDIHSHILPGVDDGSPDFPTSLSLLRYMEELGFREVWLTPHIMEECSHSADRLRQRLAELQEAYNGNITLHLGAEYMMDAAFTDKLKDSLLPIGCFHLLVETSYMFPPSGLQDLLLSVWKRGYQPLIAHPERYMYLEEEDYYELKEKGYLFQLNLMSLSGYYGSRPKSVSEKLLQRGMYDHVGTDLHHLSRYQPMLNRLKLSRPQLDALERLLHNNQKLKIIHHS